MFISKTKIKTTTFCYRKEANNKIKIVTNLIAIASFELPWIFNQKIINGKNPKTKTETKL